MKTALVTGGGGFVARRVIPVLMARGWTVRAAVRRTTDAVPAGAEAVAVGDIREADWDAHLRGVSAIVHLAARAHRMNEVGRDAEPLYRRDNVEATAVLSRAAVRAKVSRFVFISSVKAMGESTPIDAPWNEMSPCNPVDAYGRTKLAAEQELRDQCARSGLPAVILRPPLLYGAMVKGNMLRLISWIGRGVPMPLACVRNSRSLLSVGNLADAIAAAIEHPAAVGQTYMVSDGEDMSTPELIRRIARACGKQARLLPMPRSALLLGARLAGRSDEAARLLGSLRVDSSLIRRQLGWTAPLTVDAGLMEMVQGAIAA